eukprot:TRINITY_DN18250_c0_g4_i1.p1 TRINITY_DN18250_c0_g4~~TRINITY_DN18250_c0_g4_i1.p1  ORF type:complete len:177 (-),score=29.30 TRINITY_DN18250_c0_g4_i1:217-708(-)
MGNAGTCVGQCSNGCSAGAAVCFDKACDPSPQKEAVQIVDLAGLEPPKDRAGTGGLHIVAEGDERALGFAVELTRSGPNWRTLGLVVSPDDNPEYLMIDDFWEPSLMGEWNLQAPEAERVRPGYVISAVDDISGSAENMLDKIQAHGKGSTMKLWVMPVKKDA